MSMKLCDFPCVVQGQFEMMGHSSMFVQSFVDLPAVVVFVVAAANVAAAPTASC